MQLNPQTGELSFSLRDVIGAPRERKELTPTWEEQCKAAAIAMTKVVSPPSKDRTEPMPSSISPDGYVRLTIRNLLGKRREPERTKRSVPTREEMNVAAAMAELARVQPPKKEDEIGILP